MDMSMAGKGMAAGAAAAKTGRAYPAIDAFRLVAALLVVAIHTGPLASVAPTADLILNRVFARLAVPFFFMASGFFLAPGGQAAGRPVGRPLGRFLKKLAIMYGLCALLYLPLNLYMGYFSGPGLGWRLVRDVLWNGTVYHLWYFPAVMLGAAIAWVMWRRAPLPLALCVCGLLYLVGVGGDSWYGLAAQLPWVRAFYDALFVVFDYTRNGLLFAPLFVLLGLILADRDKRDALPGAVPAALGLGFGLCAMLAEALWLNRMNAPRHDSMYLTLPLCAVCLFVLLVRWPGRRAASGEKPGRLADRLYRWHARVGGKLRGVAGWVFILHPWCIVGVRAVAKLVPRAAVLVECSPLFYLCVCAASLAAALVLVRLRLPRFGGGPGRRIAKRGGAPHTRAWAEVDGDALCHNLGQLNALMPAGCTMMAVVKDDAYGHGAVRTARLLWRQGVQAFAVATLEEGIALRRHGIGGTILVLGYTHPACARRLWFWRLTQTAVDAEHARALGAQGARLRVHIKVDTGMHRLGVACADVGSLCALYALPGLRVEGLYTHLARADSGDAQDVAFCEAQMERFAKLVHTLGSRGVRVGKVHLQSSYGLARWPGIPCHYARVGLALYGVGETPACGYGPGLDLRPALALRARVASVRRVPAGDWVGYGRSHRCEKDTLVATVTAGYGDGVPRGLAGGRVLINGRYAPVLGRVCMDQMSVCADDIPGVRAGDVVTVIGHDGGGYIGVEELAAQSGSIANEILVRVGGRVGRVYMDAHGGRVHAGEGGPVPTACAQNRAPGGLAGLEAGS